MSGTSGCESRTREGLGQQPPCEPSRPSAWGRGKLRFLTPRPRLAIPPRHRAAESARGESARREARHRPGAPRGAGTGTWQRPALRKVP